MGHFSQQQELALAYADKIVRPTFGRHLRGGTNEPVGPPPPWILTLGRKMQINFASQRKVQNNFTLHTKIKLSAN